MELLPYLEHYIDNEIVQWIPWVAARSPQCFCIPCNMAWLILEVLFPIRGAVFAVGFSTRRVLRTLLQTQFLG